MEGSTGRSEGGKDLKLDSCFWSFKKDVIDKILIISIDILFMKF